MEQHLLDVTIFFGVFMLVITGLLALSKKFTSLPYTVALLLGGFITQFLFHLFHFDLHIEITADLIYFVLLPVLLFESAFNINIHQFKIQFKTISFIATVGLLLSVFAVGFLMAYWVGLPLIVALLFGAIISSTDPIAVIALFRNLGGPRRLGLVADGESMFNDATGVIAFKLISTFAIANEVFNTDSLFSSLGNFTYVFFGSMIFGAICGYLVSLVFPILKKDRVILTTVTIAFALLTFTGAEHFFHLSGVIATVVAAIVLGNYGKLAIPADTKHFLGEFWENVGFFAISLVFFFATFNLDVNIFKEVPAAHIGLAILSVLIARALSVYLGFFITNHLPFFKDEPNIPLSWQHILNWGGLRGVIPLVLVYSLPKDYQYYNEILAYTLATLLFTLLVNGLTIKTLLIKLGLHIPAKEEQVIHEEASIFTLEEQKQLLDNLPKGEFQTGVLSKVRNEINALQKKHHDKLSDLSKDEELILKSFKLEALNIERTTAQELHDQGFLNETVLIDFETELDLQQDALEYPDVFRGQDKQGKIKSRSSFRKTLLWLRHAAINFPVFSLFIRKTKDSLLEDRLMLLKTRILTSQDVMWFLDYIKQFVKGRKYILEGIKELETQYTHFEKDNKNQIEEILKENKDLLFGYEKKVIYSILEQSSPHTH